ncbi:MAG: hypothetical protein JW991_04525 [Candidatus Pacebacteria bacterium]|nr:hypothetical protein [Candidatus Paceibacterota bacterium]
MSRLPEIDLLNKSLADFQKGAIFIPQNPSFDQAAAALGLFLSLSQSGKSFSVICSTPMTVGFSQLVGVDKITEKINSQNLVVSLDYQEDAVSKVSYNLNGKKFNLIIQPKPGFSPLSTRNVKFSYSGKTDFLVTIGAASLTDLGSVYQTEAGIFKEAKILNIDISHENSRFGKINVVFSSASSYSEVIAALLEIADYPADQDIASNLFLGIKKATDNFTNPGTSAEAFSGAAFCLRHGARRQSDPVRAAPVKEAATLKVMSKKDSAGKPPPVNASAEADVSENDLPAGNFSPGLVGDAAAFEEPATQTNSGEPVPVQSPADDWYGPKIFRAPKRA